MRRLLILAVLVLLAVQPVLHQHSLLQENVAPSCAACAFGAAYVIAAPVLAAPLVVAYQHPSYAETTTSAAELRTRSSRAPPLA